LTEVFRIINEQTRQPAEDPAASACAADNDTSASGLIPNQVDSLPF